MHLLDNEHKLSIFRQCSLIDIGRNKYYYKPVDRSLKYESAKIKIADIWNEDPSRGSRQISYEIKKDGYRISRKKIGELMRDMELRSLFAKPNLSMPDKQHKKYPYLLRGVKITHPNHVWSTGITYIKLGSGHVYLTAIIDWYSRKVLSWRLSNTLDNSFCIDALYEALCKYGKPDIFNTDQGSQYTASNFIEVLEGYDIKISMDGKGRATDNAYIERLWRTVKYGHIFLWRFNSVTELRDSLKHYFKRYNSEKGHMSLDYRTPDEVYYGMIEIGKEKIFA